MVDTLNGVGIDLGLEKMHKAGQPFKVGFDAVNYANDLKMVALMFEEADSLGEDEYAGINSSEWRLLIGATMGVLGMPREYYVPLVSTQTIRAQSNIYKCAVLDGDSESLRYSRRIPTTT